VHGLRGKRWSNSKVKIPNIVAPAGAGGAQVSVLPAVSSAQPVGFPEEVAVDIMVGEPAFRDPNVSVHWDTVGLASFTASLDSDSEAEPSSSEPNSPNAVAGDAGLPRTLQTRSSAKSGPRILSRQEQSIMDRQKYRNAREESWKAMEESSVAHNATVQRTLTANAALSPAWPESDLEHPTVTGVDADTEPVAVEPSPLSTDAAGESDNYVPPPLAALSPFVAAVSLRQSDALTSKPYVSQRVVKVDPIAKPMVKIPIFDKISGNVLEACMDDGSCVSLVSRSEVDLLSLVVAPVATCPGMPEQLYLADGTLYQAIEGVVIVSLHMEGHYLHVPLAVVDNLFCTVLLGRNVRDALDDITGRQSIWTVTGDVVPVASLPPSTRSALTGAVVSSAKATWVTKEQRLTDGRSLPKLQMLEQTIPVVKAM